MDGSELLAWFQALSPFLQLILGSIFGAAKDAGVTHEDVALVAAKYTRAMLNGALRTPTTGGRKITRQGRGSPGTTHNL